LSRYPFVYRRRRRCRGAWRRFMMLDDASIHAPRAHALAGAQKKKE
jgi:hypothetical protein